MVAVLFGPLLANGQIPLLGDLSCIFYPGYLFYREHLLQGVLPLWNPYEGCGVPFLADCERAVLYPPHLIYLVLTPSRAVVVSLGFHVLLAGLGAYAFSRALRVGRAGSLLAGTTYAFNSCTLTKAAFPSQLGAIAWLPVVLWAFVVWVRRRDRRSLVLAGTCLALQFLAGYPEVVTFTVGALVLYAVFAGFHDSRSGRRWTRSPIPILGLAGVGILAMLLSMAQLLPSWEALQQSSRLQEKDSGVDGGSVHPLGVFNLLVPSVYGVPGPRGSYWAPSSTDYSVTTFYIGILPCVVFVAVAFRMLAGRWKGSDPPDSPDPVLRLRVPYLVTVLLVFLLYAMGKYTPVFGFLRSIFPLLQKFVWPTKCLPCAVLAMGCLAGIGLDYLRLPTAAEADGTARWRRGLLRWGTIAVLLAVVLFIAACLVNRGQLGKALLIRYFNLGAVLPQHQQDVPWNVLVNDCLKLSILGLVSAILLRIFMFRLRARTMVSVLIIGVLFVDLLHAEGDMLESGSASVLKGPSVHVDRLRPREGMVRYLGFTPFMVQGGASLAERLPKGRTVVEMDVSVQECRDLKPMEVAMGALRNNLNLSWPTADKVFDINSRSNFASRGVTTDIMIRILSREIPSHLKERLLRAINCDRILIPPFPITLSEDGRVAPSRLVLLDEPLPRAYVVGGIRILDDQDSVFNKMLAGSYDPYEAALLDRPSASEYWLDDLHPGRVRHQIKRLDYAPNALHIEVISEASGILVVSDVFDPGWSATVNGSKAPIYRLNGVFRGIRVEAGNNEVRMHYWPESLTIGIAVSLATLFTCTILLIPVRRRILRIDATG